MTASLRRMLVVAALAASALAAAQPANDLCANAQVIPAGTYPVLSSVVNLTGATTASETAFSCQTSTNSSVWYSFTPSATGTFVINNCAAVTGNTLSDTVLAVYSGDCTAPVQNACNDDFCSNKSSVTMRLTAGVTYLIQVAKYGTTAPLATDTMQISIDSVVSPANDWCSGTVPTIATNTPTSVLVNQFSINDSVIGGGAACFVGMGQTSSTATGPDSVVRFVPPTTGLYSVRSTPTGTTSSDSILYMTDTCTAPTLPPQTYSAPQCIAASNRVGSSTTSAEELVCISLTANTPVFIWSDFGSSVTAALTHDVEVSQCFPETESNNTPATANALSCPTTGRVSPTSDVDYYALGAPAVGARVFALVEANASGTGASSSNDFDLRVTNSTLALEYDDSNADTLVGGLSATVAGTPLDGTANFLAVSHFSGTALEPYRLYSVVQTATAVAETEPNDTSATANSGAINYFSGAVPTSTDVDFFSFTARAGEVVFVGLDSAPTRVTGSTANLNVALLNAAGTTLTQSTDSSTTVSTTAATGLTSSSPSFPADSLVYRIRTTGTYFVRVSRTVTTAAQNNYLLSIAFDCLPSVGAPMLAGISPSSGSILGGTSVTLTGSNFSPGAVVLVGGNRATVTSNSPTSLVINTPPGLEGAVDVVVMNPANQSATLAGGFTYISPLLPPTVTSVTPNSGPTSGGTAVTINGQLFKPGAEVTVTVGMTTLPATSVVVVSALQITATLPANFPGAATITVRNPTDMLEGSLTNAFTYLSPPSISSIVPASGLTDGGLTVTISGTDFRTGATVLFGATAGTGVIVDGGNELTVVTPASATNGPVNVTVRNTDTQSGVLTNGFRYDYPAPTLATVAPGFGPTDGGTSVTLTGTNFFPNPTVLIGGNPATSVTRVSATSVTARTPAGALGVVDVTLVNSDAQTVTLTGGFEYAGPPTVSSVSPNTATVLGGTTVTLTGTGFRAGATVRFGTTLGTSVVVNSPTSITVTYPSASVAGAVNVSVTNADAQVGTLMNGFTYVYPPPTITSVTPSSGYSIGGTAITVNGTNFYPGATLTVGGTAVTNLVRVSAVRLTGTTAPGTPGPADVVVGNTDNQTVTLTGGFVYVPSPTLSAISPNHGPVQGGTLVTVTGTNLVQGASLFIGGVPAFAVNVTSPTTATAVTNSSALGTFDVRLVNPDAQSATLPMAFTFDPAPTLTAVEPNEGSTAGGSTVTLTGTGFLAGASVLFGTTAATNVTVVSPTRVTVMTPARPAGVVSVTVRNGDGQYAELPRAYRFVAPPTFDSLSPAMGDVAGGALITLRGSGFAPTAEVSFGGTASPAVTYVSATELTAVTPAHARGVVDVVVTVDGASATRSAAFTYTRGAPTLTQLAPLSGPTAGGVMLTLTGTGFADGATVTLGGTAATNVVIVSANLARAVVPAHAAGQVDVVLTNDDAQAATLANGFTYVAPVDGTSGTVADGGSGSLGMDPVGGGGGQGGVSCGCTSADGATMSLLGFVVVTVLARRRRRS